MSNQATTDFQERMVAAVETLAVEVDANCERQLVRGKTENYYLLSLVRNEVTLKVYVYLDEAGFYQGEDWNMYEKCDFDSPEKLQRSVLSDLKDRVAFVRCNMETLRIANTLFKEIQNEFPDITIELDKEHKHVDLAMEIPVQEGITHGINLNLQNDELHLSVANFWNEWFPCTDAEVVADYKKAVIGYIRGDYRLLEYSKGKGVYKSKLQAYENGRWSTVATSFGYLKITFASMFSFEKKQTIVIQNAKCSKHSIHLKTGE